MSKTIDMTPTYTAILPALLAALENGTDEGKRLARAELRRMAGVADLFNTVAGPLSDSLGLVLSDMLGATDFGMPVTDEQHPFCVSVAQANAALALLTTERDRVAKL